MKRAQIRAAVDGHLQALGFGRGSWSWDGPLLTVMVSERTVHIKLKANTPQYILATQMARMTGWAEALGMRAMQPRRSNGAEAAHEEPFALHA